MPYIKQELRDKIDREINVLVAKIKEASGLDGKKMIGMLNYTIMRLLMGSFVDGKVSYEKINRINGLMSDIQQEFYRRVAAPYEDKKIEENGDLPSLRLFTESLNV